MGTQPSPSFAPDLSNFMNYEYEVDLDGDSAAANVVRMVGQHKKVLEVGAGSGAIARHLVRVNKCDVVAIEINPSSIEKLQAYCKSIYACNLNDANWTQELEAEGKFDFVIAADVLEHVYDPWTVLKGMKSLLNDTGAIILSLPHVGHSALMSCLLQEDFEYREWGLMDKTHIRFFGIHNIQGLYTCAGMSIEDVKFVIRTPEQTEFAERWACLSDATKDVLSQNRFGHVYQVVTKAVPSERSVTPIILADLPMPSLVEGKSETTSEPTTYALAAKNIVGLAPKKRSMLKRFSRYLRGKK